MIHRKSFSHPMSHRARTKDLNSGLLLTNSIPSQLFQPRAGNNFWIFTGQDDRPNTFKLLVQLNLKYTTVGIIFFPSLFVTFN